jgi:hypothetical protein
MKRKPLYGLMAEFLTPDELLEATKRARSAGYTSIDAFSPMPIEELSEAVGFHHTALPAIVLGGGLLGCIGGFAMQYYANVISYPWNIGGRPHNSWPAFIPITFELTILGASLAAVLGMLALNGLPMPYHPVFNVSEFARASQDRFFLLIMATDKQFDAPKTRSFLEGLHAQGVFEIED